MREVRVESLDGLESVGEEVRLSANAGGLKIFFPRKVWDSVLENALANASPEEPTSDELHELYKLKSALKEYAGERSFNTILEDVQCGGGGAGEAGEGSALTYDLVLRPASLYAATTGYYFTPVARPDVAARIGVGLENDRFVEQAYVIGAVADPITLAAGDDNLKALSIRGRRCSSSRFEMAPELWQVLSERLEWNDVQTVTTEKG
jgi:hypothetical protein